MARSLSQRSGGSAENLRSLNKNGVDLGIVYSGDAFLGRVGKLPDDPTRYTDVSMLSFLTGGAVGRTQGFRHQLAQ